MKHKPVAIFDKSSAPQDLGSFYNAIVLQDPKEYLENIERFRGPLIVQGVAPIYVKAQRAAQKRGIDFYNIDNGYFGNVKKKKWLRITKNDLQLGSNIIKRGGDRLKIIGIKAKSWKKDGSKILVCQPSVWSAEYFGYSIDEWTDKTVKKIKNYTDREIVVRGKPKARADRVGGPKSLVSQLSKDIFCVVASNSLVATESIINGVPAFVTEKNAASPVALSDLSKVNSPIYPKRKEWMKHLSYGQFTREEIKNGYAWSILNQS